MAGPQGDGIEVKKCRKRHANAKRSFIGNRLFNTIRNQSREGVRRNIRFGDRYRHTPFWFGHTLSNREWMSSGDTPPKIQSPRALQLAVSEVAAESS